MSPCLRETPAYRHTQIGWFIIVSLATGIVVCGILNMDTHSIALDSLIAILLGVAFLFSSLTVTVDDESIEIRFTQGIIKKKFDLASITSCRAVKNVRPLGFGIHMNKKGGLFNVSGFQAVELVMRNNRIYRIGTNEPEALAEVIREKLSRNPAC